MENVIGVEVFRAAQAWKREYDSLSYEQLVRIWFQSDSAGHPLLTSKDLLERLRFRFLKDAVIKKHIIQMRKDNEGAVLP